MLCATDYCRQQRGLLSAAWVLSAHALLPHLQHTPTLIEAYVAKAKFLKHAGQRRVSLGSRPSTRACDTCCMLLECLDSRATR